jgi:SAM-dependent methyltransferase
MQMPRRAALLSAVLWAAGLAFAALPTAHAQLAPPAGAASEPAGYKPEVGQPGKDVVWVPTPDDVVETMLNMAQVTKRDRVVDLGSGDGKITIAAAKRGARAKGIEYNPDLVELSKRNARAAGVNVELVQGDIFETDFSDADVVTMYLLPTLNERLAPTLLKMKPGTRIVSHQFAMGDWEPDQEVEVGTRRALFWRVPAQVAGAWRVRVPGEPTLYLQLDQRYQKVSGRATWGGSAQPIADGRLSGTKFEFSAPDASGAVHRFAGEVRANGRITGTVTLPSGDKRSFSARRA